MITLSRLFVHPVKSMRGLALSHAQVGESGFAFDRICMLTDLNGRFITARQYTQLLRFTPALLTNGIAITAPDGHSKSVAFEAFSEALFPTEVWGNHFSAHIAPAEINRWLSSYFQHEVQLRWVGPTPTRRVKKYPDVSLSFADGYPYLLINEASFNALQERCPAPIAIEQFRPNLLIHGVPPFAEDSWQTLRVGDVIFDLVKPCSRCILTTVNTESGNKQENSEPLRTLQRFRTAENGDVDFGQNMIARNHGVIRQGDRVEILATKPPRKYSSGQGRETIETLADAAKEVVIRYGDQSFIGNNQQLLLEQLEQNGIQIPYSCRAGICGCCRIKLEEGKVSALKQGAIEQDGTILACSCVPKSDIKLV